MMMKTVLLTFFLLLPAACIAQQLSTDNCPTIYVSGPAGVTTLGNAMSFTAGIKPYDPEKMILEWTVSTVEPSDLVIEKGQGTPAIEVATRSEQGINGINVTAMLTVKGLPEGCSNSASDTAGVIGCFLPTVTDEYGPLRSSDEIARLTNVTIQLANQRGSRAYFILSYPESITRKAIETKNKYILQQLRKLGGVTPERVQFLFETRNSVKTRIYILPAGAEWWGDDTDLDKFRPIKAATK